MLASPNRAPRTSAHGDESNRAVASQCDVLAIGLNATDTLIRVPHFPAFDSKTKILSSSLLPGGQAATAAVACHRWGLRSRYVGKIGDDAAGRLQREEFAREGVQAHLIEVPNCASQLAFIIVDESSGERTILGSGMTGLICSRRSCRENGFAARAWFMSMDIPAHRQQLRRAVLTRRARWSQRTSTTSILELKRYLKASIS